MMRQHQLMNNLGAQICTLHTQLVESHKTARHDVDIARIDLFLKSQDYNASLAKATSKLKTCENTTRGLDTRVRALEQATDFWLDEVKRLRTRLHDDTGFENWDLDRVGYLAAYRPHIDVCYESIKLNQSQKALQELRAKQKAFADRQVDLTEALNVRREHVAQRQKTREAHLKNCIEKVEKLKRELARVEKQVQGKT